MENIDSSSSTSGSGSLADHLFTKHPVLTTIGAVALLAFAGFGSWLASRSTTPSTKKPTDDEIVHKPPLYDRRMRVLDRHQHYPLRVPTENAGAEGIVERKEVSATEAVASKLERELAFANTPDNKIVTGYEEYFRLSADRPWEAVKKALNVRAISAEVATENLRRDLPQELRDPRARTEVVFDADGVNKHGPNRSFSIRAVTDCGRRPSNEDAELVSELTFATGTEKHSAVLTAVMDGHGGSVVSNYIKDNLERVLTDQLKQQNSEGLDDIGVYNALKLTAVILDDEVRKKYPADIGGSTFNLSLIIDGKDLWTANTGDSRAVLIDLQGDAPVVTQLSQDQSPLELRFQGNALRHGSTIIGHRVNDVAMARGVGVYGSKYLFTPRPKITKVAVPPGRFAVLQACDGLWDVMSSDVAGKAVHEALKSRVDNIPGRLIAEAIESRGVGDNVSVVLSVYGETE